jgi:hypothetical protein
MADRGHDEAAQGSGGGRMSDEWTIALLWEAHDNADEMLHYYTREIKANQNDPGYVSDLQDDEDWAYERWWYTKNVLDGLYAALSPS